MPKAFSLVLLMLSFSLAYADNYERQLIQKRIAPIGKVRLQKDNAGEEAKQPIQQETPAKVATAPGEQTYQQYCSTCHKGGLAGAPKFRDEADWQSRLAKMDVDELTASAIKGKNAMPAKGTCMDCSEKEIKEAVEYMLPGKSE